MPVAHCVLADRPAPSLSALESLCLDQIRFWVGVVARNRGRSGRVVEGVPFTRLPAGELAGHLMERFPFLSVTLRQVRRALSRLVELGLVVREQFWQSERWRSDYWYSLPASPDPESGSRTAASTASDLQVTPELQIAATSEGGDGSPSLQPLPVCGPNENRQAGLGSDSGMGSEPASLCVSPVGGTSGSAASNPTALTGGCPSSAPDRPVLPLSVPFAPAPCALSREAAQSRSGSVRDRIRALAAAFDPSRLVAVSPSAVVVDGKVRRIADGACSPLR
jgi:hypothetical protein